MWRHSGCTISSTIFSNFSDVELKRCCRLDCLLSRQFVKCRLWNLFIHIEHGNRVATRMVASKREVCDVDIVLATDRAKQADHARDVLVGDVKHVRTDLGVEIDSLDLDETRLAVREAGARDRTLAQ